MWQRGWTHEGKGRRGANACGGEGGHIKGRGGGGGANACGGEDGHMREREGGGQTLVAERMDT